MAANGYFWWIGAGVLVLLELMSGTFYLLMVAIGFIAGGIAHLLGAGLEIELLVAALVAMIAVTVLRRSKLGHVTRRDASHDPGVNLDIGETLKVNEWHEGRARALYRGAEWDIELAPGRPKARLCTGSRRFPATRWWWRQNAETLDRGLSFLSG